MVRLCVAVLAALVLAACGSSSTPRTAGTTASHPETDTDAATTGAASAPCGDKPTPDQPAAQKLPNRFPTVTGWQATEAVTQGKTIAVSGAVKGEAGDIVDIRDAALTKLTTSGYKRAAEDEELGFEAEAEFTGPHEGHITVRALCRDYLVVTYTIEE